MKGKINKEKKPTNGCTPILMLSAAITTPVLYNTLNPKINPKTGMKKMRHKTKLFPKIMVVPRKKSAPIISSCVLFSSWLISAASSVLKGANVPATVTHNAITKKTIIVRSLLTFVGRISQARSVI